MPITLASPFAFGNGTRLVIKATPNADETQFDVYVSLRSAIGTDVVYAEKTGVITNGRSDRWKRGAVNPGEHPAKALEIDRGFLNTPTGFTDLFALWRAGGTQAARRAAVEAHLLAANYLDASLAGT